ncbi:replication initiation associated protein [Circular ssDNA virus sp.]|uniref:replication initiation associated protein n=1 Tax=Circular ssDNA virus sp. TaxID=2805939 RepID=UPI0007F9A877|nr:replication initiation associated protein [Circular ssDNA virus sp.]ANN22660.1 replication initiation associated protein [Circular ssDNA virus sp.]
MTDEDGPRVRNIVFIINAIDGDDLVSQLRLLDFQHPTWKHVKYCIYQRECGGEENRIHFQGYMEFHIQQTYKQIHAMEGMHNAHFEKRIASAKKAKHYCMKPVEGCDCANCEAEVRNPTKVEGPWEFGEMSHQGARNDLLEVQREIERKTPMRRIAKEFFPEWVRFRQSFNEYRRHQTLCRDFKTKTFLFVGPPGKGKSTLMKIIARQIGSWYKVPHKKGSGLYFDDYDNQEVMILDEFSGASMPPEFFNLLADEHECVLPVHGGAGHQMVSKYLFIGTNYAPKFWWKHRTPAQLLQTTRRLDVVFKIGMTKPQMVELHGIELMRPLTHNSVHYPLFQLN